MSTKMKSLSLLAVIAVFLAACTTAQASTLVPTATSVAIQTDNQYAPQAGDSSLAGDTAEFVSAEAVKVSAEQVQLNIDYRLPTPCHQLRVEISPLGADNKIAIKLYSVFEKDKPCALMPLATPYHASLSLNNLPAGHYTVFINDAQAVEFDQ